MIMLTAPPQKKKKKKTTAKLIDIVLQITNNYTADNTNELITLTRAILSVTLITHHI